MSIFDNSILESNDLYSSSDEESSDDFMLTTTDNPFSPFDQWDEWRIFDEQHGYNTCGLMARFVDLDPSIFAFDDEEAFEVAMNKVLRYNLSGKHIKVSRNSLKQAKEGTQPTQ